MLCHPSQVIHYFCVIHGVSPCSDVFTALSSYLYISKFQGHCQIAQKYNNVNRRVTFIHTYVKFYNRRAREYLYSMGGSLLIVMYSYVKIIRDKTLKTLLGGRLGECKEMCRVVKSKVLRIV